MWNCKFYFSIKHQIGRWHSSCCMGDNYDKKTKIYKVFNISLKDSSLRELVEGWHKSFYLTLCLGPFSVIFNGFRGKIFLRFISCKGRPLFIYYDMRIQKIVPTQKYIFGRDVCHKFHFWMFCVLVNHYKCILSIW